MNVKKTITSSRNLNTISKIGDFIPQIYYESECLNIIFLQDMTEKDIPITGWTSKFISAQPL